MLEGLQAQALTVSITRGGPLAVYVHDLLSHWIGGVLLVLLSVTALAWLKRAHRMKLWAPLLVGFVLAVVIACLTGYTTDHGDLSISRTGAPLYVWHWQWVYTPSPLEGLLPLNLLANGLFCAVLTGLVVRGRLLSRQVVSPS